MEQTMMSANDTGVPATSPNNQDLPQDLFPLDFLSFVEATSPSFSLGQADFQLPDAGPSNHQQYDQHQHQYQPSQSHSQPHSYQSSPVFDGRGGSVGRSPSDAVPPSRGGSSKGRSRSKAPKKAAVGQNGRKGQTPQNGGMGMEVDLENGMNMGDGGKGQMSQEEMGMRMAAMYGLQGMEGIEGMEGFLDEHGQLMGMSQGMLQQFEGIHMQSPIVFDPSNPSQSYNPMAQFLASPSQQSNGERTKVPAINFMNGLMTPGASTEMYPQNQADQMMSPMQLEMLARREQMDGMPELNMAPIMSPVLNHNNSSQYNSPSTFANFAAKSPLELLQEQQRQFQDQLDALQVQQRQLQATAAAVAAAQSSPYINSGLGGFSSSGSSAQSRPVTTPGMMGSSEPSPQYFTPLTSPALEATRQYNSFSASGQRQPHPLSALSSPALNPIGSAGGAQQTLSPALHPQSDNGLSDPDYIRALVGMLDGNSSSQQQQQQAMDANFRSNGNNNGNQQFQSPSYPYHSHQSSPVANNHNGFTPMLAPGQGSTSGSASSNGNGTGPHRHSLPAKSRPSPLVKPVNHRSHIRHPSTHQTFSQPGSPAVLKGIQPGTYLPAAAYDSRINGHHSGGGGGGSLASTPSPVDLTSMMPPPPVPAQAGQKGLTPMTPAALMNLGGASGRKAVVPKIDTQVNGSAAAAKNGAGAAGQPSGRKRGAATAGVPALGAAGTPAPGANGKKGAKLVPGKKIAARPAGVGVRAATKGAAAAAQQPYIEPENRRTSHKAAEQKRRDSLKAGFDELRLLLPPINTEALDPESGEPIPGSSAPRLLPKSSLVPDDNPNRGVSKVALLKFSNEYIVKLHEKVDRRADYIERLRQEVTRLRDGETGEVTMDDGEDLLEFEVTAGEEEEEEGEGEEGEGGEDGMEGRDGKGKSGSTGDEDDPDDGDEADEDDEDEVMDDDAAAALEQVVAMAIGPPKAKKSARPSVPRKSGANGTGAVAAAAAAAAAAAGVAPGAGRKPPMGRKESTGGSVTPRNRRGE